MFLSPDWKKHSTPDVDILDHSVKENPIFLSPSTRSNISPEEHPTKVLMQQLVRTLY
jgi:hypothetical protein